MHKPLLNLLLSAAMLSACAANPPSSNSLEQAPPRVIAKSLKVPPNASLGPVVAGLTQGAVPQGMTLLPSSKTTLLTSHYADDGGPSRVVLTDWESGLTTRTLLLLEPGGVQHTGHVGGIAATQSNLWVASDGFLYRGNIEPLLSENEKTTYQLNEKLATEATHEVAFCAAYNGLVWAGEFAMGDKYPTDSTHHLEAPDGSLRRGWISGYDPEQGFEHPLQVLSIPDRTQGMYATEHHIYLSISYGRRHRSRVEVHRNPLAAAPHQIARTSTGREVPLWYLDGRSLIDTIDLPPMAQNIVLINDQLAVLFESGAAKFRFFGKKPLDYVLLLPVNSD